MDNPRIENASNTILYSISTMAYFEKHKIMDILAKLFIEMDVDRPIDAVRYMAESIKSVATTVLYTKARVNLPETYDQNLFIKSLRADFNIPAIIFKPKKNRNSYTNEEILLKLDKFLKSHNLDAKNKIFLNYPNVCDASHAFLTSDMNPATVVQVDYEHNDCMDTKLREYYGSRHHQLYMKCTDSETDDVHKDELKHSLDEVISHVFQILRNTKLPTTPYIKGSYYPRVIIYGRIGSGRRTQAKALVKRFNLTCCNLPFIFIKDGKRFIHLNYDEIISNEMVSESGLGEALQLRPLENVKICNKLSFNAVYKRLLHNDCIRNGWVLVGYPSNLDQLKILYDNSVVRPNRLFFLHCRKKVAMQRIRKQFEQTMSLDDVAVKIEALRCKLEHYDFEKDAILEYLRTKPEVYHIDANHRRSTVRNDIMDKFFKNRNKIAFT